MKRIRHRINTKTGELQISVIGMSGPGCKELTRPIEEGLGTVTDDQPTEEFYQQTDESLTQEN